MLLQLENANKKELEKLLLFAKQNHLDLSLVESNSNDNFLPGEPLSKEELEQLIADSRASGIISMQHAHESVRKKYAD
jgi:molybdenum cofactor biosynthesis enzyme MoaA